MTLILDNPALKRWLFFIVVGSLLAVSGIFISSGTPVQALDLNNCLSCHTTMDKTVVNADGREISLKIDEADVNSGAHRYIDCITCHWTGTHRDDSPLTKLSSAQKCGTCHEYQYREHLGSVHGEQLAEGNPDVATCVDCHSPEADAHSVIRVLEYSAPTYKKNSAETCAKCHADEDLMANYGIVEKTYESYMRSFHGKAIDLGVSELSKLEAATCTNCHGVHNIMATDDPESPVAGLESLVATCEECHAGAGTEFAIGFLGHKEASPEYAPVVHFTETFFNTLLLVVITPGALVVLAAVFRFSWNRWRHEDGDGD